jgi:hypothetical protein
VSINPLQVASGELVEHYDSDIHGPRKFIVESTHTNIEFVRSVHNGKLKPYLIDFKTLETKRWKHLGMDGDIQRINVEISYNDPLGKPHTQWFPFDRYGLREVLLPRLVSEKYWLLLPCKEYQPFGILLALEAVGVALTLEDVEFTKESEDFFRMEARPNSLGWYGEVYLKMV